MLDIKAEYLAREVSEDQDRRKVWQKDLVRMRAAFASPGYNEGGEYDPENVAYSLASLYLPFTLFDNPYHDVWTPRTGIVKFYSEMLRLGLDNWALDIDLVQVLEDVRMDMIFGQGIAMVTREPVQGNQEPGIEGEIKYRPAVYRIAPERFGMDRRALSRRECRYMHHEWLIDIDDLRELAKEDPENWDRVAIEQLSHCLDEDEDTEPGEPDRHQVRLVDIWIPGQRDKKAKVGHHGVVCTIASPTYSQKYEVEVPGTKESAKALRRHVMRPRAYYGPRSGPYEVFATFNVPSQPWGLSTLVANAVTNRILNEQTRRQLADAETLREFGIMRGDDETVREKFMTTPHGGMMTTDEFDNTGYQTVKVGGASAERQAIIEILRAMSDRNMALTDAQKGTVSGGSATENVFAQNAATARVGWDQRKTAMSASRVSGKAAYWIWNDEEVVTEVGSGLWMSGGSPGDEMDFYSLKVRLNLISAERENDQARQARMLTGVNYLQSAAPVMVANPHLNWPEITRQFFRTIHLHDLEGVVRPELLKVMQQRMVLGGGAGEAGSAAPVDSGGEGTPSFAFAGDVGLRSNDKPHPQAGGQQQPGYSPPGGTRPKEM